MTADEQGFDPDLNYTKEDNEFWDCTDGAHPAWWRGHDHTYHTLCSLIDTWFRCPMEDFERGMNQPALQAIKSRIRDLRKYARHHASCIRRRSMYHDGECDCGWYEVEDSMKQKPDTES